MLANGPEAVGGVVVSFSDAAVKVEGTNSGAEELRFSPFSDQ